MTTHVASFIPTTDTFGARLALVRQYMGWNQKEAALACGFPQATWREWELSGREPHRMDAAADKISAATKIDHYWLMSGRTSGPSPTPGKVTSPDGPRPEGSDVTSRYPRLASVQVIRHQAAARLAPNTPQKVAA